MPQRDGLAFLSTLSNYSFRLGHVDCDATSRNQSVEVSSGAVAHLAFLLMRRTKSFVCTSSVMPSTSGMVARASGEHLLKSLNSNELLRSAQVRTTSWQLFPGLNPLTIPLDDAEGTFLTLGCGNACKR